MNFKYIHSIERTGSPNRVPWIYYDGTLYYSDDGAEHDEIMHDLGWFNKTYDDLAWVELEKSFMAGVYNPEKDQAFAISGMGPKVNLEEVAEGIKYDDGSPLAQHHGSEEPSRIIPIGEPDPNNDMIWLLTSDGTIFLGEGWEHHEFLMKRIREEFRYRDVVFEDGGYYHHNGQVLSWDQDAPESVKALIHDWVSTHQHTGALKFAADLYRVPWIVHGDTVEFGKDGTQHSSLGALFAPGAQMGIIYERNGVELDSVEYDNYYSGFAGEHTETSEKVLQAFKEHGEGQKYIKLAATLMYPKWVYDPETDQFNFSGMTHSNHYNLIMEINPDAGMMKDHEWWGGYLKPPNPQWEVCYKPFANPEIEHEIYERALQAWSGEGRPEDHIKQKVLERYKINPAVIGQRRWT